MSKVEFHFDFGSPNAYLSHLVIPEIERRTGAQFEYVPVLLGGVFKLTGNRSPAESLAGIRNKPEYEKLETQRFIARHGITTFRPNPFFPVNTLVLMRGAVAARSLGIFQRYVDEMFRQMWSRRQKLDDPAVLRAALAESGLDAEKILATAQTQEVKDELLANTQRSVDRGTFGSPTFFVGEQIFLGKDRLRDVEDTIAAAKT
jgi:2-hydroxychromene-2-carboxylate isomerase